MLKYTKTHNVWFKLSNRNDNISKKRIKRQEASFNTMKKHR